MASSIGDLWVKIRANDAEFHGATTRMKKAAVALGGALGAAFAVDKIRDFGMASVKEFGAAEAAWNRLGGSLRNAGTDFGRVRSQIEGVVGALEDATTIGDDELAGALQTLVRITNDYRGSLGELKTVADFAAGAQIDLETAATLVGKAMVGETSTLKRYGVVVKEGGDAMQALRDRFRGMAENEAATLTGRLKQLNNEWGNLKEAIGGVIAGGDGATDSITSMRDAVRDLTTWIEDHKSEITSFRDDLLAIANVAKSPIILTVKIVGSVAKPIADYLAWAQRLDESQEAAFREAVAGLPPLRPQRATPVFRARPNLAGPPLTPSFTTRPTILAGVTGGGKASGSGSSGGGGGDGALSAKLQRKIRALNPLENEAFPLALTEVAKKLPSAPGMVALGGVAQSTTRSQGPGALSGVLKEVTSGFSGLLATFGPMAMVGEVLATAFEAMAPALEVLKIPIKAVGELLGNTLGKAISYLAEGIGWVIRAFGKAVNWLLPGNPANGMVKLGQEMMDQAKAVRNATTQVEKFAEALSNVPRVVNLAQMRGALPGGGTISSGAASGEGGRTAKPRNTAAITNNYYIQATNPREIADEIARHQERQLARGGTSRLAVSFAA